MHQHKLMHFLISLFLCLLCISCKIGTPPTPEQLIAEKIAAATQGDSKAQLNLGEMYFKGEGVNQDYKLAVHWTEKAAKQSNRLAQYNLGTFYEQGLGVPKDYKLAFEWVEKAANQGLPAAQNNLGTMYIQGQGVSKDKAGGRYWLEKAAEGGLQIAYYNLAMLYSAEGDNIQALKWFSVSVAAGDKNALKKRDELASRMNKEEVAKTETLSRQWMAQRIK